MWSIYWKKLWNLKKRLKETSTWSRAGAAFVDSQSSDSDVSSMSIPTVQHEIKQIDPFFAADYEYTTNVSFTFNDRHCIKLSVFLQQNIGSLQTDSSSISYPIHFFILSFSGERRSVLHRWNNQNPSKWSSVAEKNEPKCDTKIQRAWFLVRM